MDNTGKSFFGFGMAMCEMMSKLISPESGGAPHENIKIVLNVLKVSVVTVTVSPSNFSPYESLSLTTDLMLEVIFCAFPR